MLCVEVPVPEDETPPPAAPMLGVEVPVPEDETPPPAAPMLGVEVPVPEDETPPAVPQEEYTGATHVHWATGERADTC